MLSFIRYIKMFKISANIILRLQLKMLISQHTLLIDELRMKKFFLFLIAATFGLISVSGCKTKEHCPAYGQKAEAVKALHS